MNIMKISEQLMEIYNNKLVRTTIYTTFILGFIAHGYAMTNKTVNMDDALVLKGPGAAFGSGRWMLSIIYKLWDNIGGVGYLASWINGMIAICLIAAAAGILTYALNVNSGITGALTGGLMITFPSLTATWLYIYTILQRFHQTKPLLW